MERDLCARLFFSKETILCVEVLGTWMKNCDYYEKKMAREAAFKSKRVVHTDVRQATPVWTNTSRVNKANQFTPRPVQLSNIRPNLSTASKNIKTGREHVNTVMENVSSVSYAVLNLSPGTSRVNTGKSNMLILRSIKHRPKPVKAWSLRETIFSLSCAGTSTEDMVRYRLFDSEFSGQHDSLTMDIHRSGAKELTTLINGLTGKEIANPFKIFNDSPLSGVNTPGSDENRLKLYDLILGDDASKQGRIDIGDINTDAEITLIDETQGRINDIIADEDITLIS
ncbi:hypothetical protein Tco_0979020 [Tanacetum coccineum]|uniref:Uncharacterized protein n=1 Tax=Tanacetum coccineum TaxID=301880 RepID=A0ABQ5EQ84_9ASTR